MEYRLTNMLRLTASSPYGSVFFLASINHEMCGYYEKAITTRSAMLLNSGG